MKQHLTERAVKAMVPAIDRDVLVYDDEVTGFGVFILRSGKRGFFLSYRIAGREICATLSLRYSSRAA